MNAPRIRAPELPESLTWHNTDTPITLADQRGKVVILDFWTSCSINCMHTLPDLAWLEKRYPEELTVIGVHTPKFANERNGDTLQKSINRFYIRHPVAHDPGFSVWQRYGIKAWPTLIYIDPEGYIVGKMRGEGRRAQLDSMIANSIKAAKAKNTLVRSSIRINVIPEPVLELKFPGKILATDGRLFVSDSGHNRVLECMPNGRIVRVYGSGAAGHLDGNSEESAFDSPQGLAKTENDLYVADTGNHVIRKIDLDSREVTTVAGMGKRGHVIGVEVYDDPLQVPLNSPWDLEYDDGLIYIAMAGAHQIWVLDINKDTLRIFSGTGRESLTDGSATEAEFAQPSGLTLGEDIEKTLFVLDAESSALRAIRLRDNHTRTIVGKGLFEFGLEDGKGKEAKLQHPLGLVFDPDRKVLWVADSYNHKLRHVKVSNTMVTTVKLASALNEPGGVSIDDGMLWITNTNEHRVIKVELKTGKLEEVEIFGVDDF